MQCEVGLPDVDGWVVDDDQCPLNASMVQLWGCKGEHLQTIYLCQSHAAANLWDYECGRMRCGPCGPVLKTPVKLLSNKPIESVDVHA